jgi:hypothetical protein
MILIRQTNLGMQNGLTIVYSPTPQELLGITLEKEGKGIHVCQTPVDTDSGFLFFQSSQTSKIDVLNHVWIVMNNP